MIPIGIRIGIGIGIGIGTGSSGRVSAPCWDPFPALPASPQSPFGSSRVPSGNPGALPPSLLPFSFFSRTFSSWSGHSKGTRPLNPGSFSKKIPKKIPYCIKAPPHPKLNLINPKSIRAHHLYGIPDKKNWEKPLEGAPFSPLRSSSRLGILGFFFFSF